MVVGGRFCQPYVIFGSILFAPTGAFDFKASEFVIVENLSEVVKPRRN